MIGIKFSGCRKHCGRHCGYRSTKWKAECWIEEPSTNKETKIGTYERTVIFGSLGVGVDIYAPLHGYPGSKILRIEITINEWARVDLP